MKKEKLNIISIIFAFAAGILFLILFASSCGNPNDTNKSQEDLMNEYYVRNSHVLIYDSCEYIYFNIQGFTWGSHKGNCKFCVERNKKTL